VRVAEPKMMYLDYDKLACGPQAAYAIKFFTSHEMAGLHTRIYQE